MKKIFPFFVLTYILLILACDSQKKVTKPKILVPEAGSSIHQGQPLLVKLDVPSTFTPLDSIEFTVDGKSLKTQKNADSIIIDTQLLAYGTRTIGAKVYSKGNSESTFSNVIIVPPVAQKYSFKVLGELPHAPDAFTQGLEIKGGFLYESTGQYDGKSSLRKIDLNSGKVLQKINLAPEYFGEGLTIIGNKIYQLTWLERKGFIYDLTTLNKTSEFPYSKEIKEGWGLCYDGTDLVVSEGSNILHFLNPTDFSLKKSISVFNHLGPVHALNELEYIDGFIYANVYQTDIIVIIDPNTGAVVGEINLIGINPERGNREPDHELNGIAYDPITKRIYVTGKNWTKIFQIELIAL